MKFKDANAERELDPDSLILNFHEYAGQGFDPVYYENLLIRAYGKFAVEQIDEKIRDLSPSADYNDVLDLRAEILTECIAKVDWDMRRIRSYGLMTARHGLFGAGSLGASIERRINEALQIKLEEILRHNGALDFAKNAVSREPPRHLHAENKNHTGSVTEPLASEGDRAHRSPDRRLRDYGPLIQNPRRELVNKPAGVGTVRRPLSRRRDPVVRLIKLRVRALRDEGLSHKDICDRLGTSERPPRAAWREFPWPVAYRRHTSAVAKWLSEACARAVS